MGRGGPDINLPDSADRISGRIVPDTGYRISGTGYRIIRHRIVPDITGYRIFFSNFLKKIQNFFRKFFQNFSKILKYQILCPEWPYITKLMIIFKYLSFLTVFSPVFHCFSLFFHYPVSGIRYRIPDTGYPVLTGYLTPDTGYRISGG